MSSVVGDSSCIGFLRYRVENQTNSGENSTHATAVGVGDNLDDLSRSTKMALFRSSCY